MIYLFICFFHPECLYFCCVCVCVFFFWECALVFTMSFTMFLHNFGTFLKHFFWLEISQLDNPKILFRICERKEMLKSLETHFRNSTLILWYSMLFFENLYSLFSAGSSVPVTSKLTTFSKCLFVTQCQYSIFPLNNFKFRYLAYFVLRLKKSIIKNDFKKTICFWMYNFIFVFCM